MPQPGNWNNLLRHESFHWKDPEPAVVELTERWRAAGVETVLDLGCGAGRHTGCLEQAGFRVFGTDAGLSTNVLNHNPRGLLQRSIDEVHRVLRPGGEFYVTVLNTWDWRHGNGEEVEPDSFVLAHGPEAGILHHFFSEADLRDWLSAFEMLRLDRETGEQTRSTRPDGLPVIRDAWCALVRK
jgi:SAM-dependent methyltransferase